MIHNCLGSTSETFRTKPTKPTNVDKCLWCTKKSVKAICDECKPTNKEDWQEGIAERLNKYMPPGITAFFLVDIQELLEQQRDTIKRKIEGEIEEAMITLPSNKSKNPHYYRGVIDGWVMMGENLLKALQDLLKEI